MFRFSHEQALIPLRACVTKCLSSAGKSGNLWQGVRDLQGLVPGRVGPSTGVHCILKVCAAVCQMAQADSSDDGPLPSLWRLQPNAERHHCPGCHKAGEEFTHNLTLAPVFV